MGRAKKEKEKDKDKSVVIVRALEELKAHDIQVLDISALTTIADRFILASGDSPRHLQSLADEVHRELKENGVKTVRMEGTPESRWILIDTGDIILHVFDDETRRYYGIESFWHDAKRVEFH